MIYQVAWTPLIIQIYKIMKRIVLTAIAVILLFSCASAQNDKAKVFKFGIKVLGSAQITTVDPNSRVMVTNADKDVVEISIADLSTQIGGGGGPVDAALSAVSNNAVRNSTLYNRFLQSVDAAGDSPLDGIKVWIGNKAAFGSRTPVDSILYVVTDSIPATPIGAGDMLKSIYDTNDNNIVDNAENLGGVPAASYLTSEVDGSVTNELQTISITGSDITLSNGGGTITVPGGGGVTPTTATFTPALEDGSGTTPYTYTLDYAEYYKVGKIITVSIKISGINGTAPAGGLEIRNLPFGPKHPGPFSTPVNVITLGCTNYNNNELVFYLNGTQIQAAEAVNLGVPVAVAFTSGSIFINATYFSE